MLDKIVEESNKELEKGNAEAIDRLEDAIDEERENTREDLTKLHRELS